MRLTLRLMLWGGCVSVLAGVAIPANKYQAEAPAQRSCVSSERSQPTWPSQPRSHEARPLPPSQIIQPVVQTNDTPSILISKVGPGERGEFDR